MVEEEAATLYSCYPLIRPDVALELAWKNRLTDYVMPFILQFMRETTARIATLEARTKPAEDANAHAAGGAGGEHGADGGFHPGFMAPTGMLAIANEAYNPTVVPMMGGMGAMGMPGMGVPGMGGMGVPGMGGGFPPQGGYGGGSY